jgi:hypothetical protein
MDKEKLMQLADKYAFFMPGSKEGDEARKELSDAIAAFESAVLEKLAGMELPEPETFESWNAKQHGDPEEIGLLQALRIAYCCGQDSVNQRKETS